MVQGLATSINRPYCTTVNMFGAHHVQEDDGLHLRLHPRLQLSKGIFWSSPVGASNAYDPPPWNMSMVANFWVLVPLGYCRGHQCVYAMLLSLRDRLWTWKFFLANSSDVLF